MSGELIRFLIVGIACALLFFGVNYATLELTGSMLAAIICAYSVSFPTGYLLQRRVTFASDSSHLVAAPRYFLMHALGGGFVYLATSALHEFSPENTLTTSAVVTGMAGLASFILARLWVFAPSTASRAGARLPRRG